MRSARNSLPTPFYPASSCPIFFGPWLQCHVLGVPPEPRARPSLSSFPRVQQLHMRPPRSGPPSSLTSSPAASSGVCWEEWHPGVDILECPSRKRPQKSLIHATCTEHPLWPAPVQALQKDPGATLLLGPQTASKSPKWIQLVAGAVQGVRGRACGAGRWASGRRPLPGQGWVKRRPRRSRLYEDGVEVGRPVRGRGQPVLRINFE